MAQITINTTAKEQQMVLDAIKQLGDETISVYTIAKLVGLNPSKTRYVILDLIAAKKIKRIPVKAFNKHYIRYRYEVL